MNNILIFRLLSFSWPGHVNLAVDILASTGALTCSIMVLTNGSFLLSFNFLATVDLLLALRKLLSDLLGRSSRSCHHPGVSNDISKTESLVSSGLQHAGDEVLELFGVEPLHLAVGVVLPEEISPVGRDELVVRIAWVRTVEWGVAGVADEQNNSEGKEINHVALVWLLQQDFWGHVGLRAKHGLEEAAAVASLYRSSEAEVRDLHVEVLVKQDVLRLQVAVSGSVRVDVVHHL